MLRPRPYEPWSPGWEARGTEGESSRRSSSEEGGAGSLVDGVKRGGRERKRNVRVRGVGEDEEKEGGEWGQASTSRGTRRGSRMRRRPAKLIDYSEK